MQKTCYLHTRIKWPRKGVNNVNNKDNKLYLRTTI